MKGEDDKPNEIAIGYRVKRLNNKYEFVWYYCGTASEGMEETNETKADKVSTQTGMADKHSSRRWLKE